MPPYLRTTFLKPTSANKTGRMKRKKYPTKFQNINWQQQVKSRLAFCQVIFLSHGWPCKPDVEYITKFFFLLLFISLPSVCSWFHGGKVVYRRTKRNFKTKKLEKKIPKVKFCVSACTAIRPSIVVLWKHGHSLAAFLFMWFFILLHLFIYLFLFLHNSAWLPY